MGSENRQNWYQEGPPRYTDTGGSGRGVFAGMPKPGKAVLWLLIANGVMFLLGMSATVHEWTTLSVETSWQIWRFITFQFMHADILHILFNMIGLYFLGMVLEQSWGTRRFLTFYLSCGVFAGICHLLYMLVLWSLYGSAAPLSVRLLGASGGVFAIVLACAILFPQIRLLLFFFPVPIRVVALIYLVWAGYNLLMEVTKGISGGVSDAAHLGGAGAAAFWIWVLPKLQTSWAYASEKRAHGAWQRRMKQQAREQAEIDRILEKIKRDGLNSLSGREKKTLQQATQRQQQSDRHLGRL